jgi:hypothetical protein
MKRKPPVNNVRVVGTNGFTNRGNFWNRFGELIQSESQLEECWILVHDSDPTVESFSSQPRRFEYFDKHGKLHTHVVDFLVNRVCGDVEYHDVTLIERLEKDSDVQMYVEGMTTLFATRDEKYILNTDQTLPGITEFTNLRTLICYRSASYHHGETLENSIFDMLEGGHELRLGKVVEQLCAQESCDATDIIETIMHLIWHRKIQTNKDELLISDAELSQKACIWVTS